MDSSYPKKRYFEISKKQSNLTSQQMHKIIYSPQSSRDLHDIYTYIAQDNLFYANKVTEKIRYTINLLKTYPFL